MRSVPFLVADWGRDQVARALAEQSAEGVWAGRVVGAVFAGRVMWVLHETAGRCRGRGGS